MTYSVRALGKWETNSTCDTARGTDGIQFPPDIKKEDRLDVFFGVYFCRSIGFSFDHDEDLLGVRVKHFSQNSFYDSKSDDDRCYCTPSMDCDQDGVFHAGPCMQGAPIFFSKPHFLEAPFYQANITGLKPDPGEHDGWLKIEPWLGQTALAGIKLQPNIALEPDHSMKIPFAPNLLPLLWIDGTNGFGQEQVDMLNSLLFNKIRILRTMASVLLVAGFVLVTAFLYYNHRRKGQLV